MTSQTQSIKEESRRLFEHVWLNSRWTHRPQYVSAQRKQKTGESIIEREDNGNYVLSVRSDLAPLVSAAPELRAALRALLAHRECPTHSSEAEYARIVLAKADGRKS